MCLLCVADANRGQMKSYVLSNPVFGQAKFHRGGVWMDGECDAGETHMFNAAQYLRWQSCYRQISALEEKRGRRYAWVLRVRTDAEFLGPFPTYRTLMNDTVFPRDALYKPPSSTHVTAYREQLIPDQFALLPRHLAPVYLVSCPEYMLRCPKYLLRCVCAIVLSVSCVSR
mmetsp:Transcript_38277/g.89508  ORF Transcript_38277/g.89508 Transcript_38277/m.89508 type:complete len:171 (+) Transcript_38277:115-627(+)